MRTVILLLVFAAFSAISLAVAAAPVCPRLPGNQNDWKEQEHWVWKEICEGRAANLQLKYGGPEDPSASAPWPAQRDISQRFLFTILMDSTYLSRIPDSGIVISGAHFHEELNFVNARLQPVIRLPDSWFERRINLRSVETKRTIDLHHSFFGPAKQNEALSLAGAKIGGDLELDGVVSTGHLNMDSLTVGNVGMRYARFASVWLANARIAGELDMSDTTVEGELRMLNLMVEKDLKLRDSRLTGVILRSAIIGGDLAMEGPNNIGSRVCPLRGRIKPRGLPPQSVDMTDVTIKGTLIFGSECYGPFDAEHNWGKGARLDLRNASVRTLQAAADIGDTVPFGYDAATSPTLFRHYAAVRAYLDVKPYYGTDANAIATRAAHTASLTISPTCSCAGWGRSISARATSWT